MVLTNEITSRFRIKHLTNNIATSNGDAIQMHFFMKQCLRMYWAILLLTSVCNKASNCMCRSFIIFFYRSDLNYYTCSGIIAFHCTVGHLRNSRCIFLQLLFQRGFSWFFYQAFLSNYFSFLSILKKVYTLKMSNNIGKISDNIGKLLTVGQLFCNCCIAW